MEKRNNICREKTILKVEKIFKRDRGISIFMYTLKVHKDGVRWAYQACKFDN